MADKSEDFAQDKNTQPNKGEEVFDSIESFYKSGINNDDQPESNQKTQSEQTQMDAGNAGNVPPIDIDNNSDANSLSLEYANRAEEPNKKGAQHSIKKSHKKPLLVVFAAILIILAGCCIALAVDDSTRTKHIPTNTTLDGIWDIATLTADELRNFLKERSEQGEANYLHITVNGKDEKIKMNSLGTPNAEKTIQAAFSPYDKLFLLRWIDRIQALFGKQQQSYNVDTAYDFDQDKLKKRIKKLAKKVDVKACQATYEYDAKSDGLIQVEAKDGIKLNVEKTIAAIQEAFSSGTSNAAVTAVCEVTKPKGKALGQAILVDTNSCRLRFYQGDKVVFDWPCTPGMSGHETPRGTFSVSGKQYMPTWINPHSEWSKNMDETIAPGPTNPLGLRALEISCGGGIYIHGTVNLGQLGSVGSHGCIRLSNDNVCTLYDKVKLHCPVIIR